MFGDTRSYEEGRIILQTGVIPLPYFSIEEMRLLLSTVMD
jgi:hypothetical protein